MTIKVHGELLSTATSRVLTCLHETGLDYEFVPINMLVGEHKKKPFISINPFGQVPGFEDGDLILFESRAINRYITSAYPSPLVPKDPKKMAIVAVGLEVEAHHYDKAAGNLTFEICIKPMLGMTTDEAVVEAKEAELGNVLDLYEAQLGESKYLSGDAFTLTDLHHLPTLEYLMGTRSKAVFDARPRVSAWCANILARPSWKKVLAMRTNK